MNKSEKAQELFDKGLGSLEEGSFNEALHYFNESLKIQPSSEVEDKIKECKEKIKEKYQNESKASDTPNNADNSEKTEDEIECEKIIEEKDYYKLLNVSKETIDPDELKKAYKKLAIKFHPDKNKSSKAEDAFKKISTAYQTLNDPEKKKMYDKYGTEEEFREKYYQANQQRYEEEEDVYDLFDILFNDQRGRRRRRRNYQPPTPEQQRRQKYMGLLQLLIPIIFVAYPYVLALFATTPLYAFEYSLEYPNKKVTTRYKVTFYSGEQFNKKFPNITAIKEEEGSIENAYLSYAYQNCLSKREMKEKIENMLWYIPKNSRQYYSNMQLLKQIDFSICDEYRKLKNLIENAVSEGVPTKEEEDETEEPEDTGTTTKKEKQEGEDDNQEYNDDGDDDD